MTVSKRKKEKEKFSALASKLEMEMKKQKENHEIVFSLLQTEKFKWFTNSKSRSQIVHLIVQHCLFPRALFSPADAIYTAKFIKLLHNIGTPNFSSLSLFDRIINDISFTLIAVTSGEAGNYGKNSLD